MKHAQKRDAVGSWMQDCPHQELLGAARMEASPHRALPQTGSGIFLSICSDAPAHRCIASLPRQKAIQRAGKPALPPFSQDHENAIGRRRQQRGATAAAGAAWPQAESLACSSMSAPRRRRQRQPVLRAVKEEEQQQPAEPQPPEPLYASKLFRVAPLVLFTLGFIDAGYSGDWSRIGVVSSEVEAALRLAAFVVVPTSAVLIWLIVRKPPSDSSQ